jgi:transposase
MSTGLTTSDVARRYRVGESKVRSWIARGELAAVNTADIACSRPRYVVTADALAEFEKRRSAARTPAPRRRRRKAPAQRDYYPGD